jgi:preprotein translocase subunit Sec63
MRKTKAHLSTRNHEIHQGAEKAITRIQNFSKKDYYSILGLEESCSANDIKKAYHKLLRETHPGKNKYDDAPKAFKR